MTRLLVSDHTVKFKNSHDLVVSICRSMNEFVVLEIYFQKKYKHIIEVFVVHPFYII